MKMNWALCSDECKAEWVRAHTKNDTKVQTILDPDEFLALDGLKSYSGQSISSVLRSILKLHLCEQMIERKGLIDTKELSIIQMALPEKQYESFWKYARLVCTGADVID